MTLSDNKSQSYITDYYKNKSIFITGGSGFVGKALIEKLLRSCPELNKIYLLLRHKKGKKPSQRLDEIINCKVSIKNNLYLII
jgi:fatty acyl-CoA reductase